MHSVSLSERKKEQLRSLGITEEQLENQIALFRKGTPFLDLDRPCTPGDGLRVLTSREQEAMISLFQDEGPGGKIVKFVPASGAASRMFKTILSFRQDATKTNEKEKRYVQDFLKGLTDFAFFEDLRSVMRSDGLDPERLAEQGRIEEITRYLILDKGLHYAELPKGLIKFHGYTHENRTAFEEHLVESTHYSRDDNGICRLHFTVSGKHKNAFKTLLNKIAPRFEKRYSVTFDVHFSEQRPSTDTIAVDLENRPCTDQNGSFIFRPGGHGALLENLNSVQGDMVFIKNIDNVLPDRLKDSALRWKRILGGVLIKTAKGILDHTKRLREEPDNGRVLGNALSFAQSELSIALPGGMDSLAPADKRKALLKAFNRPLRICGMVKNRGEPGGGPFWVREDDGTASLQIVEKAQVDPQSEGQQSIFKAATHFNPVDIVCRIKDSRGSHFDLQNYVDHEAVFISRKSIGGKEIKALELPGLWNGSMARWNTIFIEVPEETFAPVKTINDLLRQEHRP